MKDDDKVVSQKDIAKFKEEYLDYVEFHKSTKTLEEYAIAELIELRFNCKLWLIGIVGIFIGTPILALILHWLGIN